MLRNFMTLKGKAIMRKKLLFKCILIVGIFFSANAQAKNYYVSSNGNNSNDGLTEATAWQTIAKVNSFIFGWGDFILFKRGDTFYGNIVVSRNNLNYGAYGNGAKPIITGLSTVTGWVNLGGNIWEAPVTNVPIGVNLVLRDGAIQQIGRYPNPDAANGGYLTYTAATTTSITGPQLSTTTNWTGAEVAIRLNRWDIRRQIVTAHSGGVVSFASNPEIPRLNYGYFFQRDARTLDKDGEWWHNEKGSKLRMYFGNNNPGIYNIQIATIDTLIFNNFRDNLTISDLSFYGSGKTAIFSYGGLRVTIKNCDVINSGAEAITARFALNFTVDNCTTTNSLGSGIRTLNNENEICNVLVKNCTTTNTAYIVGMETSGDHNSGAGIACERGDGITIQNNAITNSGYVGMIWKGDNVSIKYNFINTFCTLRDDGAGIYSVENEGSNLPTRTNRKIIGNIIINGRGNNNGTNNPKGKSARGLYFDLGTRSVLADSNTVANVVGGGFHGNNNASLTITNNVFFNTNGYSSQRFADAASVRNMTIKKNIVYPYRFEYRNLGINSPAITKEADILAMGVIDSNYYSLKNGIDTSLTTVTTNADGTGYQEGFFAFPYLTGTIGIEKNSINVVNTGTLEYNASNTPIIVQFSGLSKKDVFGNVYNNSATIPAWRSMVLIPNGTTTPNKAPVANAGTDKTIILPTNSSTLTGTATDADGTILSYAWVKISGPSNGTVASPTTASTAINSLVQGIYKFEFTVTDNNGATGKDTVQITVNLAGNQIPKANAGSDKTNTLPTNSTTLTGTGTDTDGTIASYAWAKIAGPSSGTIASPAAASTAINNLVQGIYQFELKVTDNGGAIGRDTVQVTVNATGNQIPKANAGLDKTITLPTNSTTLTGTGTDTDGTIASYAWAKVSGPSSGTIASAAAASTAINNLVQGIYQFELKVTDNGGAIGRDTVQVTVNGAINQTPIANAGTDKAITLPTNSISLSGIGTDADGTIASYAWTKISGPTAGSIASPAAASTAINNLVQGIYQFELRVTDNGGAIGRDTVQVTVNAAINQTPIANAGTDKEITLPTNSISLSGFGTDADGTIASYAWIKISGPTAGSIASPATASTEISNLVQGVYQFELNVTDNNGAVAKDTMQATVNPQPVNAKLTTAAIETINCSGASSTVNVTANGGTTPYIGTGSFITDAGKGTLKISFPTSVSTTQTTIYFKVGNVVAGKSYALRFTTLGSMDDVQMNITFKKYVSPFTTLAPSKTTNFGTSIKQHELIFTPTVSDADSRIDLWLTQNTGITYLDNIAFFEVDTAGQLTSNNVVPKGQFETDLSALRFWSSNGNQLIVRDSTSKIGNINYYAVTDALGRVSTVGLPIKQSAILLTASVSLEGSNILTVSASGGTPPYIGTGTFTGIIGLNTFIVTDANGCTATASITISPLTAIAVESPVDCSGSTSSVTVTSNGGAAPYTGTGIFNTNAGKGTLRISFPTSVSTTQTTIYFKVGNVVAGKSYGLRFTTLGSMDNVPMDITLKKYVSPFTLLATSKTTNFGTSIKQHELIFTPTISDVDARIDLWLTQNAGITYLDNIAFFEVDTAGRLTSNNVVPKGQFETDISAVRFWSSNSNQLVQWDNSSKISNINYYTVTDASGSISTIGLPIKQSATILTAAVSQSSNNLIVSAAAGTAPYTGSGTFAAKLGLNTFTVTDANGCTATTSINVTNLSAARVSVSTTPTATATLNTENPSQTFKITCFPNPAYNEFGLFVEGKNNEKINVLIISEDGRIVFQTTGMANKRYKFGEDFAAGLYIIKVTNGNASKTLKIIKSSR